MKDEQFSVQTRPSCADRWSASSWAASGAAMLPYTVIKEANPPEFGGSATGVINFINFTVSALLGPVFGSRLVQASAGADTITLGQFRAGFKPLVVGIFLALVLALLLKETPGRRHGRPEA